MNEFSHALVSAFVKGEKSTLQCFVLKLVNQYWYILIHWNPYFIQISLVFNQITFLFQDPIRQMTLHLFYNDFLMFICIYLAVLGLFFH